MVIKILQKHQQKRRSLAGRLKGVHTFRDDVLYTDDGDDAASALELALNNTDLPKAASRSVLCSPERTAALLRSRSSSQVESAAGTDRISKRNAIRSPSQLLKESRDDEIPTASSKTKKENWIRSLRAAPELPGAFPAQCEIRISPTLLTGLLSAFHKAKRSPSNRIKRTSSRTTSNRVYGYIRLLPETPSVMLATGSPNAVKSLPLPHAKESFLVWATDFSDDIGSLLIVTKPSTKDVTVTLEVGVASGGEMFPLGTTTFQPGCAEVSGRQSHLKVDKTRKIQNNGLFRLIHHSKKSTDSDYRLSRDSFLSITVDIQQISPATDTSAATGKARTSDGRRERALSSVGTEGATPSAALESAVLGNSSTTDGQPNRPSSAVLQIWPLTLGGKGMEDKQRKYKATAIGAGKCADSAGISVFDGYSTQGAHSSDRSNEENTARAWSHLFSACFENNRSSAVAPDKDNDIQALDRSEEETAAQVGSYAATTSLTRVHQSEEADVKSLTKACSELFGDADVESPRASSKTGVNVERAAGSGMRIVPTPTTIPVTEISQVASPSILMAWFGEEDVETLRLPYRNIHSASLAVNVTDQQEKASAGLSSPEAGTLSGKSTFKDFDRDPGDCRNDALHSRLVAMRAKAPAVATTSDEATGRAEDEGTMCPTPSPATGLETTLNKSYATRRAHEVPDGEMSTQLSIDDYTYVTSQSEMMLDDGQGISCFPFLVGAGSSSSDSSASGSSMSAATRQFRKRDIISGGRVILPRTNARDVDDIDDEETISDIY